MLGKAIKSILLLMAILCFFTLKAQIVYKTTLREDVGPNAWRLIKKSYDQALSKKANYFLLEMNTAGGAINYADSIRTLLLQAPMKTIVYIDNNAASAGALIALASDYIFMQSGSSIGAAAVVNDQGAVMPEKYQSYMRGLMRATAETKARDPLLAEAFVDPNISAPIYKPEGNILTLTSSEAVRVKLAEAEVTNLDDIYKNLGIINAEEYNFQPSWIDYFIKFLTNPYVNGVLIVAIIGGLFIELQSPGIGFALGIAIIAAILFFAPLYLQGLADNWEIGLFALGCILLAIEILLIPGFGIAGILGLIFILCGLGFSMLANDFFDFKISQPGLLMNSFLVVLSAMVFTILLLIGFGKNILRSPAFSRLVLKDEQLASVGYTSSIKKSNLIKRKGIASTVLRPSGKIEIDGILYDAVAIDGFISPGEPVRVERQESYSLFVRKINDLTS